MSFYLHQEKLDDHIDSVQRQIRQIRLLRSMICQIEAEPEQYPLISDSIRKLDRLESGLNRLSRVLEDHAEDMRIYFRQLEQELDVMTHQIDTLFE